MPTDTLNKLVCRMIYIQLNRFTGAMDRALDSGLLYSELSSPKCISIRDESDTCRCSVLADTV